MQDCVAVDATILTVEPVAVSELARPHSREISPVPTHPTVESQACSILDKLTVAVVVNEIFNFQQIVQLYC